MPRESCRLTLAPRCSSIRTIASCPPAAAAISSVASWRSAQRCVHAAALVQPRSHAAHRLDAPRPPRHWQPLLRRLRLWLAGQAADPCSAAEGAALGGLFCLSPLLPAVLLGRLPPPPRRPSRPPAAARRQRLPWPPPQPPAARRAAAAAALSRCACPARPA